MPHLDNNVLIAIAVGVVLIVIVAAMMMSRRKQSAALHDKYGSHYDLKAKEMGQAKAAAAIAASEKRFQKASIRDLSPADRERYAAMWQTIQGRFVDSPALAVTEADRMVSDVMTLRGYPAADHDQRLADVAVGHPTLLEHYRSACDISRRVEGGHRDTEDLRQALVHYRALFEDLLGPVATVTPPTTARV